jgi:ribulose-5-phosphate 4-epimerase/fuculose-1-phosphate aldolase
VHEARPDVACVIHTHTVAGIAIASLECGLLPVSQSAMRFADVAYHDFEGVAFEPGEKERLARDLGQRNVMILRNHGLLACGATIAEAFNNIYRLERACQIQAAAMACNSPIIQIPADLVRKAGEQYAANPVSMGRKPTPLGVTEWPAMLRLLDRRDPSYRT